MADKDAVVAVLRATLLSCKGSLTLQQANRDYRELEGEYIPFKRLGYQSLEKLFQDIPGFVIVNKNGEWQVDAIPSKDNKHITDMIARQKPAKKNAAKRNYAPRFQKNDSWRKTPTDASNYNYNYNNKLYKYTPHRPSYNNNYHDQSYQPYEPNEKKYEYTSNKTSPDRPESKPLQKKFKPPLLPTPSPAPTPLMAKPVTAPLPPTPAPGPSAAEPRKTPTVRRKVVAMSTTQRLQSAMKAAEKANINQAVTALQKVSIQEVEPVPPAQKTKPKVTGAKGRNASLRLNEFRESLNTVDTIPLPLPATSTEPRAIEPQSPPPAPTSPELPELALNSSAQDKLRWTCKKLHLPEPIFKVRTNMQGPATAHCVIKVGDMYSVSSYPDSTPTSELAVDVASLKLLALLESVVEAQHPTTAPDVVLSRLAALVAAHSNGLYVNLIPQQYRKEYGEKLPSNWQDLVETSPDIVSERVAQGLLVLLPKSNVAAAESRSPERLPRSLPLLRFPEHGDWNVFITVANSTIEVWLRLIGEEYSDAYTQLLTEMDSYYAVSGSADARPVEVNVWYAVQLDEGWHRGLVLEVYDTHALVFLGDHGDEELLPFSCFKLLESRFCQLPTQAILCRLEGLEELGSCETSTELVRNRLVGQILIAVPTQADDAEDPTVAIVLYQTLLTEDVNINETLLKDFCALGELHITEKLCEVEVGCVSQEGHVWVVGIEGAALVRSALNMLTTPGPFQRDLPPAPTAPKSKELYMVCTLNGEWLRCMVRNGMETEDTVSTRLVDSGKTMRAPLSSLVPLANFSSVLSQFPHQAVAVKLGPAQRAAQPMVSRLRELLLEAKVLCRLLSAPHPPAGGQAAPVPQVELFVRSEPQRILASVNNAILLEFQEQQVGNKTEEEPKKNPLEELLRKKERIFSRNGSRSTSGSNLVAGARAGAALPPPELPALHECVNVLITMTAHPWNFVVQMNKGRAALTEMMKDLQIYSKNLTPAESPALGQLYTVKYHKDQQWYRVVVANVMSPDTLSVYFCDFGDLAVFAVTQLFHLPETVPLARKLPPQAIKSRLFDVTPLHQDWTVEDCIRFQDLCVDQEFAAIVQEISADPLNPSEPLLTLELIDTSTTIDIYLSQRLVLEGRARLTSAQQGRDPQQSDSNAGP